MRAGEGDTNNGRWIGYWWCEIERNWSSIWPYFKGKRRDMKHFSGICGQLDFLIIKHFLLGSVWPLVNFFFQIKKIKQNCSLITPVMFLDKLFNSGMLMNDLTLLLITIFIFSQFTRVVYRFTIPQLCMVDGYHCEVNS